MGEEMTPEIALQIAVRDRLVDDPEVTALVPAASILDRHMRPAPDPSIILGEKTSRMGDGVARQRTNVWLDLHVWKKEPSTEGVTHVAGVIRDVIGSRRLGLASGFHCADLYVESVRLLRDPDGITAHAVLTIAAIVEVKS
jgi:hypothetical protein